jgi:hypothetical protein
MNPIFTSIALTVILGFIALSVNAMWLIYYEQYSTGVFGQFDLTTQIWVPQNFSTVQ